MPSFKGISCYVEVNSRILILCYLFATTFRPCIFCVFSNYDDDQDYNAGDADDTYTLSQESSENNVLVVPAKDEKQDEKAEKKNKFVQVLSYFADLLTDEKYKDFRPPGQVSYS